MVIVLPSSHLCPSVFFTYATEAETVTAVLINRYQSTELTSLLPPRVDPEIRLGGYITRQFTARLSEGSSCRLRTI